MIKNFWVNRENFKVLVYWYYFGANVDKEKLLSVWSEKNVCVCVCVWFILNVQKYFISEKYDRWVISIKSHEFLSVLAEVLCFYTLCES
jgi:hypothetical protein